MENKTIVKTIFSISGLIIFGKLLGFVKQVYVAAQFGTSIETDIVSIAEGFIANTQYLLVQVLLASFTAVYIHAKEKSEQDAKIFSTDALKAFSYISIFVVALVILLSYPIGKILAPSYTQQQTSQVALYLKFLSPALVLFVCTAIFHAILNSNERFIPGELTSVNISWITVLVVFLFAPYIGVEALVVSIVAYALFNALFLAVISRKYFSASKGNPFKNPYIKKLLRMAVPLILSYSVIYINQQVNKILVSGLEAGTVTAMNYAAVLANLINTFIITFCSILFTYVASAIAKNDQRKAEQISEYSSIFMLLVFIPITIVSVMVSDDIITVVFGRGAFKENSISATSSALRGYAFTFIPLIFREVYSRVCYGYQDSKRPTISSVISILINLALSIVLCPYWGVFGVTLASSVSVLVCGILNFHAAKKHGCYSLVTIRQLVPAIILGSTLCIMSIGFCMHQLSTHSSLSRFIVTAFVGCLAYFVPVIALKYKTFWKPMIAMLKK